MITLSITLLLAGLASRPADANQERDRETLLVLGFNNACSVAVAHYVYPKPATPGENPAPMSARVGRMALSSGKDVEKNWLYTMTHADPWEPEQARDAEQNLRRSGYQKPGFLEVMAQPASGQPPAPEELARTSGDFSIPKDRVYPPGYRLIEIRYSPLLTCALLIYRQETPSKLLLNYILARVKSPEAVLRRSGLHLAYAQSLLDVGEIQAALAETKTACGMAPHNALARYRRAALLSMTGSFPESLKELEAALRQDQSLKPKARRDVDFEPLFKDRAFKELTR